MKDENDCSTHDSVKVGFHELFVDIDLIEVPIWAKDNVHVIQAGDLLPIAMVAQKEREEKRMRTSNLPIIAEKIKEYLRSCVCGNAARTLMIRRGGRAT
jgi:hypothetical protein